MCMDVQYLFPSRKLGTRKMCMDGDMTKSIQTVPLRTISFFLFFSLRLAPLIRFGDLASDPANSISLL
jgi:hypothetical protein